MMRPPSRICRAASCVATNKPRTLMAISFSKSSSENCSMGAKLPVPALFTRISIPPNVPMVLATANRTASVSAASALIASAFPPAASIERTTSSALPGDALYVRATAAPSVASRLAIAAPMLREPPLTSATLPASFFAMFVFIFFFQMSFSNCESGIDGCVSRRNCLTGQGRGCRGVFHETGEMFAVAPEQEQGKQRNHNRHRQSRRCHQDVEAKDVHDYRTHQCEAKWRPPTGEQEDAAHDLQCTHDI